MTSRIHSGDWTRSGTGTQVTAPGGPTGPADTHTLGCLVVHRLPWQPSQRRGIDAKRPPAAPPRMAATALEAPVLPGHLTSFQQPGEQHLTNLPHDGRGGGTLTGGKA
jgi:hypothetical protein